MMCQCKEEGLRRLGKTKKETSSNHRDITSRKNQGNNNCQ